MSSALFTGCATAIITPFSETGIDYNRLARQLDRQVCGGVSAIVVCGTTGEAPAVTEEEYPRLLRFCAEQLCGRVCMIAGIGSNNTYSALHRAEIASACGADGVLMVTPYYNKTSRQGLIEHFSYVADRSPLPLIIYNVPGRTGIGCTADIYAELSAHPGIVGVKEASGDFSLFTQTLARCGEELPVWCGNDDQTLAMMSMGAKGVISVASNLIPREISTMCAFAAQGRFREAAQINQRFSGLFRLLFSEVNPIPVKKAMELMGLDSGLLRLPLCTLDEAKTEALSACLEALELI